MLLHGLAVDRAGQFQVAVGLRQIIQAIEDRRQAEMCVRGALPRQVAIGLLRDDLQAIDRDAQQLFLDLIQIDNILLQRAIDPIDQVLHRFE